MHMRATIALVMTFVTLGGTGTRYAQPALDPWFTLTKLAPNLWAAIDNPQVKQRSFSNAGFVLGDDGVIVFDTVTGDDSAGRLLQEIRKLTNLPLKFVVNTHYHGDH